QYCGSLAERRGRLKQQIQITALRSQRDSRGTRGDRDDVSTDVRKCASSIHRGRAASVICRKQRAHPYISEVLGRTKLSKERAGAGGRGHRGIGSWLGHSPLARGAAFRRRGQGTPQGASGGALIQRVRAGQCRKMAGEANGQRSREQRWIPLP